jgi:hypothetical protein
MIMTVVVGPVVAAAGGSSRMGTWSATAAGVAVAAPGVIPLLVPQPVRTAAVANATRVMDVRRTVAPRCRGVVRRQP